MDRCAATTQKGTRCRNRAMEGSQYCNVHAEREEASGPEDGGAARRESEVELGEAARTLIGAAVLGAIVLVALKLGRRF